MPERLAKVADLRRILDAMPNIVWVHRPDGTATYLNESWTKYTGLDFEQTVAVGPEQLVHPHDRARIRDAIADASRGPVDIAYRLRRGMTGEYRWHQAHLVPMHDEAGELLSWIGTATDVDDLRRHDEEQKFLLNASTILNRSLDVEATLRDVAALVVPELSDWCAIDLLKADGNLARLAVAHVDPAKVEIAHEVWKRAPPQSDDPNGAFKVIRTREPELLADINDALLATLITDTELLAMLRRLGLRSSMCVPLVSHDSVLGALTLVSAESARRYGEHDLRFATDFARRIAGALENAQLYTAAEDARRAAEALAADVLEQSRAAEAALLRMRKERDEATARAQKVEESSGATS